MRAEGAKVEGGRGAKGAGRGRRGRREGEGEEEEEEGPFPIAPSSPPKKKGIGLDSCVIPLRHGGLSLVQTTDFFYPLVEDPYMMVTAPPNPPHTHTHTPPRDPHSPPTAPNAT